MASALGAVTGVYEVGFKLDGSSETRVTRVCTIDGYSTVADFPKIIGASLGVASGAVWVVSAVLLEGPLS